MASVLVIDDDPDLLETVEVALEDAGHQPRTASDGQTGVRLFRLQRPEVVLVDIIMPGSDGLETIREIRAIDPTARIVAMSGARLISKEYCLSMATHFGAVAGLAKPFNLKTLIRTIEYALANRDAGEMAK